MKGIILIIGTPFLIVIWNMHQHNMMLHHYTVVK
jgi:hypothetical protein